MPLLFFSCSGVVGDGECRSENFIRKTYVYVKVMGKINLNK